MGDSETGQVSLEAAKIYEEYYLPSLFQEWCPRALTAVKVKPGDHIVDIACGTGALAVAAHDISGAHGRTVGVDINQGMLEIAKQKSSSIDWITSPAENLPFDDNQFDCVVSQFGLMYFENKESAVREMHRVLKPNGYLAILVWDKLENNPGFAAEEYLWQKLLGGEIDNTPFAMGDSIVLENLIKPLDLRDIEISAHNGTGRFKSIQEWIHTGAKGWTEDDALTETQLAQLVEMAEVELSKFKTPSGTAAFPTSAYIVSGSKR